MINAVSIVGYGRFGRALGERCATRGLAVRAWDPAGGGEDTLAEAVAGADLVVLAVPVRRTGDVARDLRPLLGAGQVVLETGSVKTSPIAALEAELGDAVPWAGTHPLFGPTSLARGERPLRAVVCPNPRHPRAAAAAEDFYARLGCEVLRRDPETHDREMAESHALAFFLAKGLLDAGFPMDGPLAPPSARGMGRTVESVRADAGQLYATIERANPYAAETRHRLLDALQAADDALRAPAAEDEEAHREAAALRIPAALSTPQLLEARDVIDELDAELMELLARRAEVSLRALAAKADTGHGVRDPRREADLLSARRQRAAALGLDPDRVEDVFHAILAFSRTHQVGHAGGSAASRDHREAP